MARGWESKSVEQQQELASSDTSRRTEHFTAEQIAEKRRLNTLELSRKRFVQQIEVTSNPRHRQMLEAALAELDKKLGR